MGTKERLLQFLEQHSGEFTSGEALAQQLQVSRTAIWKAINALRASGYKIQATQNRGYRLDACTDILSLNGLTEYLDRPLSFWQPELVACTASTNALVRERAASGAPEGLVILANQQTEGRGRLGRTFYSPPDTGLYLSLLLHPANLLPGQAVKITTMAAVAACEAIESFTGKQPEIKWVNDILIDSKKVCGILTEGSFSLENGRLQDVVVGVGFNVYPPADGFPETLEGVADSIFMERQNNCKNQLAARFLNRFLSIYQARDPEDYAAKYRDRSMIIGKPISVTSSVGTESAYALDIDRDCHLIVRYEDGRIQSLSSAEVSIRPLSGQ